MNNYVNFHTKHNYFNDIYHDTHPYATKGSRVYNKPRDDFGFRFKENRLIYNKKKEIDITKKSIDNFRTFTEGDIDLGSQTVQNRISYYLTNNLVPVKYFSKKQGFSHSCIDRFTKSNRYQSPEVNEKRSYITDKFYNLQSDEISKYYEKYFHDKVKDNG
jgi:hypothetical protein